MEINGSLQIISKSISNPREPLFVWPFKGCLFGPSKGVMYLTDNPVEHNENVMFACSFPFRYDNDTLVDFHLVKTRSISSPKAYK